MIRPRALQATLGILLVPMAARACPELSLSCFPRHHLALNQETSGGFTVSRGPVSTAGIGLGLGADYFVIDNLSVGARAGIQATRSSASMVLVPANEWAVAWGLGIRAGYNFSFARRWSFWPRLGLGFDNVPRVHVDLQNFTARTVQFRTVSFDLYAPVVVHPNPHFFVGFGPQLTLPVYAHAEGFDAGAISNWTFGFKLLIGGHF